MAVSFASSLENNKTAESTVEHSQKNSISTMDAKPVFESSPVAVQSGEMVLDEKYKFYPDYSDDKFSVIDGQKNVSFDSEQINLTQESNSQYIPFKMPRYYDGFDLHSTSIVIYYVNPDGNDAYATPINVSFNTSEIRFGWLIDKNVTAVDGTVEFEIHAIGTNSNGDEYCWKTKPSNALNVLKSLSGKGAIEPDSTWVNGFLSQVTEQVGKAQEAANKAKAAVSDAESIKSDVQNLVGDAQGIVNSAKSELSDTVDAKITAALVPYCKEESLANAKESISSEISDIKRQIQGLDGLAKFNVTYDGANMVFYNGDQIIKEIQIRSEPSDEYTASIDEKINVAVNAAKSEHETFATKEALGELSKKTELASSSAAANKVNIDSLAKVVSDLQNSSGKDDSNKITYDASYDEDGNNTFILYEIENEGDPESEQKIEKAKFVIKGGSGGSETTSTLKIEYITKTPLVITTTGNAIISYRFSGVDTSGDAVQEGTATWKVDGVTVHSSVVPAGENSFDLTDYISVGTHKVLLSVEDDAGSLVTKKWTVQKLNIYIESSFDDTLSYPAGPVSVAYTPYGAVSKDVHFVIDGKESPVVTTSSSGIPMDFVTSNLSHGSHSVEIYISVEINNEVIKSNVIRKDIICLDSNEDTPVIGCSSTNISARQYDTINITYSVFDPKTEYPAVELFIDGDKSSEITLDNHTQTWQVKFVDIGSHALKIKSGPTEKIISVDVEKINIDLTPVTAGLAFDFNPVGYSNNSTDRLWSDKDVSMTVSENFDWTNGGYQIDGNGDQYFCIKAGTYADINYNLFADDAKKNGKEFKLVFKVTNVQNPNATFLRCVDNTLDTDYIGIRMDAHEAFIYGQADKLHLPYSEDDVIEFEFNISKNTESIPVVMGYEDGVSTCAMVYDGSYNFTQQKPKTIHLGSDECDLHIYRFKVYNTSLTARGILSNFIADARNADEMIARYNRNQIYDENQMLNPDVLAEKCPQLRVIKLEAPWFTNNKSDKVTGTTIEYIYKNGDPVLDNWKAYNSMHSGQGTSSNNYGAAGRNLDLIFNKSGLDGVKPYVILGDGSKTDKISLTRSSVQTNYLNVKLNIASSENANNALLQKRYDKYNPWHRPFVREDESEIPKIKDTMEFFNCVVFIKENDPDLSTHREFGDNEWHFYGIGNVGDSKKTDKTRLTDPSDKYECIVEIMDVSKKNSAFQTGEQAIKDLEADAFDESETYGFRYIWKDGSTEENEEVVAYCKQKWIDFYKFVVNSDDKTFHDRFSDYFVANSALYFYLFTLRYTMVDNRAKNTFWHYGKTGETGPDGQPVRKWDLSFDYDNDTALGINNYGRMTFRYGYEDIDVEDGTTTEVFRESKSTFFCRLRDLFAKELKELYNTLESQSAWSATGLINQFDEWQSEFPEELWRLDIERKYIRTYNSSFISGPGDAQYLRDMANGKKKYQRRQYERSQEKYMASKFQTSTAIADSAILRCTTPSGDVAVEPNYTFRITPYAYMYVNVKHGTSDPIQVRATPNVECVVPYDGDSTDIVNIYSASMIESLGDLSPCYPATVDVRTASRLKHLIIGNKTSGYENKSLISLTLGANNLLESLNIENESGLTQALDISNLKNLKQLYAHGSNIGGVTFADGGNIATAELPSVSAISMSNLSNLTNFDVESFERLTRLVVDNCSSIDALSIIKSAPSLNRVRISGIDWTLDDTSILDRLYNMAGIDKGGYNTDKSIVSGRVHVTVIRQQKLYEYNLAWPDLDVSYDTLIEQFPVIFKNDNGETIEIQYVDKGEDAVDPCTREINPIVPKKESTVSHDFTFDKWDASLLKIFSQRVITATYTSSLRKYTIKYVSKGVTMQESIAKYGDNIPYSGEMPVYTAEESGYVYYLFNRWDKSGFIDGYKTVNAVFDRFEYSEGAFDGKELSELSPVEIYAMNKLGLFESVISDKDSYSISIGRDVEYDDIQSKLLIGSKMEFNGSNYLDTGIKLFDEDRDFVLAIDYKFTGENVANAVLAQCFQSNGQNGFKLWIPSTVKFSWGTSSDDIAASNKREMIVIRHKKGENNITIYKSNLDGEKVLSVELSRSRSTTGSGQLVFGCARADDGIYENFAIGNIYWCKLWYCDLGDDVCKNLAIWTHENIEFEACGFRKYYLSDNSGKRCSFSLLAKNLLGRDRIWNTSGNNSGGWKDSTLNKLLNTRFYMAFSDQMRALIKYVKVPSSVGAMSSDVDTSDCYVTVPSAIELDPSISSEPYINEGTHISYLTTNDSRKRAYVDGNFATYWTRSPNVGFTSYVYQVNELGRLYGYSTPNYEAAVLVEISI